YHSVILSGNGSVYTWGANADNELGRDSNTASAVISKVSGITDKVVSIYAARNNTAAVTANGDIMVWGSNDFGQLANDTVSTNGYSDGPVYALKQGSGTLRFSNIVAMGIGKEHMTAVLIDGTVWSWGNNYMGQLGTKNQSYAKTEENLVPVLTGDDEASKIIFDYIKVINEATGMMTSEYIGSESIPPVIIIADDKNIKIEIDQIKRFHSVGFNLIGRDEKLPIDGTVTITSDNTLIATVSLSSDTLWEDIIPFKGDDYERGDVEITAVNGAYSGILTVRIKSPYDFADPMIASGENFTVALKSDGTVWAWGDNTYGQLGTGDNNSTQGPKQVLAPAGSVTEYLSGVLKVSAGKYHVLAMTSDGEVISWGWNEYGQLGDNTTVNRNRPVKVLGGEHSSSSGNITLAADIAAGGRHSLVALSTGAVYSWGANDKAQLGKTLDQTEITDTAKELTPVRVIMGTSGSEDSGSSYIEDAIAVAAGEIHSVALLGSKEESLNHAVLTWGGNDHGQVGNKVVDPNYDPVDSLSGELGVNIKYAPEEISATIENENDTLKGITAIAAGKYHTVLLRGYNEGEEGGEVLSFGSNLLGQLGRNSDVDYIYFAYQNDDTSFIYDINITDTVMTSNKSLFTGIAASGNNTMLIDSEGYVYNFGDNSDGQLGTGSTGSAAKVPQFTSSLLTSEDGNSKGEVIGAGEASSFVMKENGYVWAYGRNSSGQLGDISHDMRTSPVLVGSGAEDVLELSVRLPSGAIVSKPNVVNVIKGETITAQGGSVRSLRGFNLRVDVEGIQTASNLHYSSSDTSVV
ncbi:MAG: hypothetical protein IJP94_05535, partial [Clostridia bacterium]|nr:hypothetical protein [Clostridia bacterium]